MREHVKQVNYLIKKLNLQSRLSITSLVKFALIHGCFSYRRFRFAVRSATAVSVTSAFRNPLFCSCGAESLPQKLSHPHGLLSYMKYILFSRVSLVTCPCRVHYSLTSSLCQWRAVFTKCF